MHAAPGTPRRRPIVNNRLPGRLMRHSYISLATAAIASLVLSASARNEASEHPDATAMVPQVTVATAISRKVTGFDECTGRFEAVERIEVRPQLFGYISSFNFSDV